MSYHQLRPLSRFSSLGGGGQRGRGRGHLPSAPPPPDQCTVIHVNPIVYDPRQHGNSLQPYKAVAYLPLYDSSFTPPRAPKPMGPLTDKLDLNWPPDRQV